MEVPGATKQALPTRGYGEEEQTWLSSLERRIAQHSSRRGMDKCLSGATLVLAVTSVMEGGAFEYTALMYNITAE